MPEIDDESSINLNGTFARLFVVLTRRRWWILLPFGCAALATIAIHWRLPNRHTSTATLLEVQQQAPQRCVVPNNTADAASSLQAMKQEVFQLKGGIEGNLVEIENFTTDQKRLTATISRCEHRTNRTPVREQQQAGILLDTEVLRAQYSEFQQKERESRLATNLETQQ